MTCLTQSLHPRRSGAAQTPASARRSRATSPGCRPIRLLRKNLEGLLAMAAEREPGED